MDLTREEVENYCDICKLNPHIDHTNFLPIYTRNKLRLELIPLIEKEFNPEVKAALVRLSKQAEEDESFMYDMASNEWRRRWNDDKKNLSLKGFENMHRSIAKRVLFMCAAAVGLEKDIDAKHIENILGLVVEGEEARELDLTNHIYARYSYGKLWFLNRIDERGIIKEAVVFPFDELDENTKAVLDIAKMRLILSIIHINEVNSVSSGSLILDYNRLNRYSAVYIRNRQAGDRIRVRGLNGTKKVQDFMTDRKIPKHERDRIPLIVADGEVVAVGGEAAENCCITAETDMVLTVEFR